MSEKNRRTRRLVFTSLFVALTLHAHGLYWASAVFMLYIFIEEHIRSGVDAASIPARTAESER